MDKGWIFGIMQIDCLERCSVWDEGIGQRVSRSIRNSR